MKPEFVITMLDGEKSKYLPILWSLDTMMRQISKKKMECSILLKFT